MTILRVDHIQLAIPPARENDARAFYGSLLGLSEVAKPPHLASRGGCWFSCGVSQIHLGVEAGFRPARKAHPAFVVDDLPALARLLQDHGYPVIWDGDDRLHSTDPFENRLEFIQPAI